MKRTLCIALAIIVMVFGLFPASLSTQAQGDKLHVVASFSILADVVGQVGGDAVEVETLIPLGSNPHAFEPSARDVATLSDADLVFVVGINFEEGLLDVLDEAAGDRVVTVSDCVAVRPLMDDDHDHEGDQSPAYGDSESNCEAYQTAADAAFSPSDSGEVLGVVSEGACDDAACDPHVWTDPANVVLWTYAIRAAFSERDPANAALYAANAETYLDELVVLDADIRSLFDPIPAEQRVLVTNHLTFNYFAARYGLATVGVILPGGSTGSEPSARDVIGLIDTIKDSGAHAIFTETTVNDDLAEQIADETGVVMVPLYTGSLSDTDGPAATYLDYMRFNAGQIAAALQ